MRYLILLSLLLTGCAVPPPETHAVVAIGDCTPGTGGYWGEYARCRVTLENGRKVTLRRPIDLGDRVFCRHKACWVQ